MTCGRIVVGIHDNNLSQKMQLEPGMTLKKAYLSKVKVLTAYYKKSKQRTGGSRSHRKEDISLRIKISLPQNQPLIIFILAPDVAN